MDFNKKIIFGMSLFYSSILVTYFGYILFSINASIELKNSMWIIFIFLIIIWILIVLRFYYWTHIITEWINNSKNNIRFIIFYIGGIILLIWALIYFLLIYNWFFILITSISLIFHTIYWYMSMNKYNSKYNQDVE